MAIDRNVAQTAELFEFWQNLKSADLPMGFGRAGRGNRTISNYRHAFVC